MNFNKMIPAKCRTIAQQSLILITGLSILCTMSCERKTAAAPSSAGVTPDKSIHLERVTEAEAVFSDMGLKSWIYKHKGGDISTEFKVIHRPPGKDQKQQIIFHAHGDASKLRPPVEDWEPVNKGGHITVSIPRDYKSNSYVRHHFSIDGMLTSQKIIADKLFSDTIRSAKSVNSVGTASPKSVKLQPGETRQLVDFEKHLPVEGVPEDEWERIRYILNVTALDKD